ncbi:MAG: GGDEF domain-containing protein [Eubacteriales bacterium]
MNADVISKSILNEMEDVVYISNPKTHELYYINASGLKTLGNPSDEQWRRKKCHKILQGLDEPCPFCTNHQLSQEKFHNWEHYNPWLDKYYDIQDKLVTFDGVDARLEIAKDITRRKHLEHDLRRRLDEQWVLNSCIATLHTTDTPDNSICKLLHIISDYHDAERAYIFKLSEDNSTISNTHEWCKAGVVPQLEVLQDIDASIVTHWFEKYETIGEFSIDSLSDELDPNSQEYQILADQDITSLVTAPLRSLDGTAIGFIGVDNAKKNVKNTYVIRAASSFIADFFDKNEQLERLNKMSLYDSLTGLKNRHSYNQRLEELEETPPQALGVLYVDLNGLKAINDQFGHKAGDHRIQSISCLIRKHFQGSVYRIGGDEFVALITDHSQDTFHQQLEALKSAIVVGGEPRAAIGYSWREGDCNIMSQIEEADNFMYKVKSEQYATFGMKSPIFHPKYRREFAIEDDSAKK